MEVPLTQQEHHGYWQQAGLIQYVAHDGLDVKYTAKELMRDALSPTRGSQARLKRLLRYLKFAPRLINDYLWAEKDATLYIMVHSDHVGCRRTRKSTTGIVARRGSRVVAPQRNSPVVSLSSGEAEFHAIVRGITMALFLKNLLDTLEIPVGPCRVDSDLAAGRGMISPLGVGKRMKHIDVQFMLPKPSSGAASSRFSPSRAPTMRRMWRRSMSQGRC